MQALLRHRLFWWSLVFFLAIGSLILALRDVDLHHSFVIAQRANIFLLALAGAAISGSYGIRALRWHGLLVNEHIIERRIVFWATTIGYLGNSLLPARAGDIIRSVVVSYWAGVSKSFVLTSVAVERIAEISGIALVSLSTLALTEEAPEWISAAMKPMAVLAGIGVATLFFVPHVGERLAKSLPNLPVPTNYRNRVMHSVQQVSSGFRTLQHVPQMIRLIAATAVIWFLETLFTLLIAQALGLTFSALTALLLLCALSLASAVPSTPGYVGIFQFVAVTLLTPFGISADAAIAYIVVFQLVQYVMVAVWGGIGLWRLGASGLSLHRLREETAAAQYTDNV